MPRPHDVRICRDGIWSYVSMQGMHVCPCDVCQQDIVGYGWQRAKNGWVVGLQHPRCFKTRHPELVSMDTPFTGDT